MAGPTPRPYVGTFPKTALFDKNTNYIQETTEIFRWRQMEFFQIKMAIFIENFGIYRKYYRKHRFIGVFEHRTPKLLILDPALVTDIFVKYFKNFGDNTFSDMVRPWSILQTQVVMQLIIMEDFFLIIYD